MIIKQITKMELHFDNFPEYKQHQDIYEKKGYKITLLGCSSESWYFECEKVEIIQ